MAREDDVVYSFMQTLNETRFTLATIDRAVRYGFQQGESFGKYGAYVEKQNDKIAEAIIQPENDKLWRKELDDIMKDCRNVTCRSNEAKTVRLLGLIAEMILYRRNGG